MLQPCEPCEGRGIDSIGRQCGFCGGAGEAEYVEVECSGCGDTFPRAALAEERRIIKGDDGPFCSKSCTNSYRRKVGRKNRAPCTRNDPADAARYLSVAGHPDGERLAREVACAVRENRKVWLEGDTTKLPAPADVLRDRGLTTLQELYIMRAGLLLSGTEQVA